MTAGELKPLRKVRMAWLVALVFLLLFGTAAVTGLGFKKRSVLFGSFALALAVVPLWGAYSMNRAVRDARVSLTRLRVRQIVGGPRPALSFEDRTYDQLGISIDVYRSIYRSIKAGDEVELARSVATGRVVSVNGIPLGL